VTMADPKNTQGRGIAGMPAFLDPYNPDTLGGSVNFGHEKWPTIAEGHPVQHAADYGGMVARGNEREDWTLQQWADLAKEYGIAVSGTKQEVIDRVLAYEDEQKGA